MRTVLEDITPSHVTHHPFPHLVIHNALPQEYYQALAQTFPDMEAIKQALQHACTVDQDTKPLKRSLRHLKRSNRRVNLPSKHVVDNAALAQVWRDFINAHSDQAFVQQLMWVFSEAIAEHFPGLMNADIAVGRRGTEMAADFWVDALTAVNTPFRRKGEITGPHTDHPNKLFIGLYYFKQPQDTAGGNLLLYKRLTPVTEENLKWPKPKTVEPVYKVDYEANSLVILLNTPQAVHGVTPRDKTPFERRFVNFIVESKQLNQYAAISS